MYIIFSKICPQEDKNLLFEKFSLFKKKVILWFLRTFALIFDPWSWVKSGIPLSAIILWLGGFVYVDLYKTFEEVPCICLWIKDYCSYMGECGPVWLWISWTQSGDFNLLSNHDTCNKDGLFGLRLGQVTPPCLRKAIGRKHGTRLRKQYLKWHLSFKGYRKVTAKIPYVKCLWHHNVFNMISMVDYLTCKHTKFVLIDI